MTTTDRRRRPGRTSPLVRRLLDEAGIDPEAVAGSGPAGRVTREDAERAIAATSADTALREVDPAPRGTTERLPPAGRDRAVAAVEAARETAQLTAVVEADLSRVVQLASAGPGPDPTPLPFVARAVCLTLARHPVLNASMDLAGGSVTYHQQVDLRVRTITDEPHADRRPSDRRLPDAQDLTVTGLARLLASADAGEQARCTFTLSDAGATGTLWRTPPLVAPEVAHLSLGAVEKRPVVVERDLGDALAIRWMSYLSLTYDHRLVDGADAGRFLRDLSWTLQHHDFAPELARR